MIIVQHYNRMKSPLTTGKGLRVFPCNSICFGKEYVLRIIDYHTMTTFDALEKKAY